MKTITFFKKQIIETTQKDTILQLHFLYNNGKQEPVADPLLCL